MMTITYEYDRGLYVNLTNRCDCACVFCVRHTGASFYADDLWLEREPSRQEALEDLLRRDLPSYQEIVFCGFGEPMYRVEDIVWLADELRARVPGLPPLRINTNGHASLIHGRDVTPLLAGRIDVLSVSLNASNPADYVAVTRPRDGQAAWLAMLEFVRLAKAHVPQVVLTIVDKDETPGEIAACRALAEELGVPLRVRSFVSD